ncbi:P-loop containing nucleoside triphosphate hydrolase protein, partial [Trametes coccinea BRFM310]
DSLQSLYRWIDMQREALVNVMIRRDRNSLDASGKPIQDLPPLVNVDVLLTLRPDEMEIQRLLAEELRQQNVPLNGKNLHVSLFRSDFSFYLGIRKALLHKKLGEVPPYVFPANLREVRYQDDPSTKIDALIALLKYHQGKSCAQPAQFNGNTLVEPPYDEKWPRIKPDTVDKALVYLSFPSSNFIVKKALEEAGIAYLENNSKMTAPARHQALNEFENGNVQVLLVSNVGTVGLNIAFANIVICVDSLWSAQEREQLLGRIHRLGQTKACIAYSLVAKHTSDTYIVSMSDDK